VDFASRRLINGAAKARRIVHTGEALSPLLAMKFHGSLHEVEGWH
jgi:hypothetical protein